MIGGGLQTPVAQVREQLERLRYQGLPFDYAWKRALERVRWPEDKVAREEWKAIIRPSVWESAYQREGEPPKGLECLTTGLLLPEHGETLVDHLVA